MAQDSKQVEVAVNAIRDAFETSQPDVLYSYKHFLSQRSAPPAKQTHSTSQKRSWGAMQDSCTSWKPPQKLPRHSYSLKSQLASQKHISEEFLCSLEVICDMDKRHIVSAAERNAKAGLRSFQWKRLFDWGCEIIATIQLPPSTVPVGMNIIDRYLIKNQISGSQEYQAVVGAGMLIAAKMNAESYFDPKLFSVSTGIPYKTILSTEAKILNVLSWNVNVVTAYELVNMVNGYFLELQNENCKIFPNVYLQMTVLKMAYRNFKLSTLRASSIAVACVLTTMAWSNSSMHTHMDISDVLKFSELTNLSFCEVMLCTDIMMEYLAKRRAPPV